MTTPAAVLAAYRALDRPGQGLVRNVIAADLVEQLAAFRRGPQAGRDRRARRVEAAARLIRAEQLPTRGQVAWRWVLLRLGDVDKDLVFTANPPAGSTAADAALACPRWAATHTVHWRTLRRQVLAAHPDLRAGGRRVHTVPSIRPKKRPRGGPAAGPRPVA